MMFWQVCAALLVGGGVGYAAGWNQARHPGKIGAMFGRLINRMKGTKP